MMGKLSRRNCQLSLVIVWVFLILQTSGEDAGCTDPREYFPSPPRTCSINYKTSCVGEDDEPSITIESCSKDLTYILTVPADHYHFAQLQVLCINRSSSEIVTEEVVATFIMTDLDFNPLSICNFRVDYHLYDPRIDCRLQGCGYSNGGCFNRFKAEANATACYNAVDDKSSTPTISTFSITTNDNPTGPFTSSLTYTDLSNPLSVSTFSITTKDNPTGTFTSSLTYTELTSSSSPLSVVNKSLQTSIHHASSYPSTGTYHILSSSNNANTIGNNPSRTHTSSTLRETSIADVGTTNLRENTNLLPSNSVTSFAIDLILPVVFFIVCIAILCGFIMIGCIVFAGKSKRSLVVVTGDENKKENNRSFDTKPTDSCSIGSLTTIYEELRLPMENMTCIDYVSQHNYELVHGPHLHQQSSLTPSVNNLNTSEIESIPSTIDTTSYKSDHGRERSLDNVSIVMERTLNYSLQSLNDFHTNNERQCVMYWERPNGLWKSISTDAYIDTI